MELNPQVIEKKGKKKFVVLPYEEFLKVMELLEDYEDLSDLRAAKKEAGDEPGIPLDDVIKDLKLDQ